MLGGVGESSRGGETDQRKTLVAVLLNPPCTTTGTRTRNAVGQAVQVLGYEGVVIVNLCATATSSVVELNGLLDTGGWAAARNDLRQAVQDADGLLGAWGVAGMTGKARKARDKQVEWLCTEAARVGHTHLWMLGGEPRHPSRWHQYVSDKHARTAAETFDERLREVLRPVHLGSLGANCETRPW